MLFPVLEMAALGVCGVGLVGVVALEVRDRWRSRGSCEPRDWRNRIAEWEYHQKITAPSSTRHSPPL